MKKTWEMWSRALFAHGHVAHLQVFERIECFSRQAPTDGPCRDKDGKPPPAEFDWHHTAQWEKDCEIKVKPVPPTSVQRNFPVHVAKKKAMVSLP